MAKKTKYPFEATLVACGDKWNFNPGDTLELGADEAKELLAAESVRPLDPTMPDAFYPKGHAPVTATKTSPRKPQSGSGGAGGQDETGEGGQEGGAGQAS